MKSRSAQLIAPSRAWLVIALSSVLAACSGADGISEGGEVFDAISAEATISLIGNEPFWGMTIAPEGIGYIAIYSAPDNPDGVATQVTRFAGNNGLGFSGELNDAPLQIALTPGTCSDTMSDTVYPYTATVSLGGNTLFGCAYTNDDLTETTPEG